MLVERNGNTIVAEVIDVDSPTKIQGVVELNVWLGTEIPDINLLRPGQLRLQYDSLTGNLRRAEVRPTYPDSEVDFTGIATKHAEPAQGADQFLAIEPSEGELLPTTEVEFKGSTPRHELLDSGDAISQQGEMYAVAQHLIFVRQDGKTLEVKISPIEGSQVDVIANAVLEASFPLSLGRRDVNKLRNTILDLGTPEATGTPKDLPPSFRISGRRD